MIADTESELEEIGERVRHVRKVLDAPRRRRQLAELDQRIAGLDWRGPTKIQSALQARKHLHMEVELDAELVRGQSDVQVLLELATEGPYKMVKDLCTRTTVADVNRVLDGNLEPFIRAFLLSRTNARQIQPAQDGSSRHGVYDSSLGAQGHDPDSRNIEPLRHQ